MSDTEQPTPTDTPAAEETPAAPEADTQPEQPAEEQPPPSTEDSQPEPTDEQPASEEPQPTPDEQPSSEPPETQPEEQPKEPEGEAAPTAEGEETPAGEETEGDKKEDEDTEDVEEVKEEPVIITPEGNALWLSDEDVLGKGLPESEVENFKHFYFKQTHSIQAWYENLKDYAFQTEFITLSKEEIEALSVEGDPSEDQQAVLTALEDRVNQAIELYGDGALVRVNGRSPKDAVLDRNEEAFIQEIRDAVVNDLEVAKQAANAYAIWKDQQHHPGVFKRGIDKIRRSFRRTRTHSTGRREQKPKLEEEEKKDEEEAKREGEKTEGEAKPEGEAEPKPAEEGGAEVTIEVEVEGGAAEDKPEDKPAEEAQPEEKPAEEAPAEPEPEPETAPEPEAEAPKEEESETPAEPKEDDTPAPKEEDGEIQKVEDGEKKDEEEAPKDDEEPAPSTPKKKSVREHHQHPKAKAEPLDNQVLRAFLRVTGARYRVSNGKEALEFVRKSGQIRRDLNQLKAFGGVEGVQVSMSVTQWQEQVPLYSGMCFRGFVYKNELTALSQVNDSVYFPNVDYYKSTIQFKVQEFFKENVQECLKELENYIIDFYVAPEKVYVTRLNPFYTNVGACLFIWSEHGRVLTQGPFEFRIVETPKTAPDGYSSFQPQWATMFESVLQQKRNERRPAKSCVLL